jgi:hypothetical protein
VDETAMLDGPPQSTLTGSPSGSAGSSSAGCSNAVAEEVGGAARGKIGDERPGEQATAKREASTAARDITATVAQPKSLIFLRDARRPPLPVPPR